MKMTQLGRTKFIVQLNRILKNPEKHNMDVWVKDAESKYEERGHSVSFEVNYQYTKSGNPELIDLNDRDFCMVYKLG